MATLWAVPEHCGSPGQVCACALGFLSTGLGKPYAQARPWPGSHVRIVLSQPSTGQDQEAMAILWKGTFWDRQRVILRGWVKYISLYT